MSKYYVTRYGFLATRLEMLIEINKAKTLKYFVLSDFKEFLKSCFATDCLIEAKKVRRNAIEENMERKGLC
jgi:hypothetical protein